MSICIRQFNANHPDFLGQLDTLLKWDAQTGDEVEKTVRTILSAIQTQGDDALLSYTTQLDRLHVSNITELEVSRASLQQALEQLSLTQRSALQNAADRIRVYHERQKKECGSSGFMYTEPDGTRLGQKVTPLDRVGLYVPGGKAAYPSSVLMNAIPAKVAGVQEVIMVVPTPDGVRNELVLAAAALAQVDRVFTIGGAQAIGALAYGTQTIPAVDKIVGPGNAYVAAAKRHVFGTVGIDMIAGPSEILIICDGSTDPNWIAMDLFSQAEHDELAQSILICPDASYLMRVLDSMNRLLDTMPRKDIIRASLTRRGAMIQVNNLEQACDIANRIAPEHLEISTVDPSSWAEKIHHAGALFLGKYSSESLGDYCAGPNHVLPTSRTARFSSPLGVYDFQKRTSIIEMSESGAQTLGVIASELAHGEGLFAHARSAEYRLNEHS